MKGNIVEPNFREYLGAVRKRDLRSPDRKRSYNRRLFAVVAPRYHTATRYLSFGRDQSWKRLLVRRLSGATFAANDLVGEPVAAPAPQAVDLACGTGDIALALAKRFPGILVVGIDISPQMLRRARRNAARMQVSTVHFHVADMNALPFKSSSVAVVTGGYALRNAPHLQTALREVHRVLLPGGEAAFLEFSTSSRPLLRLLQLRLLRLWGQLWGLVLHGNPEVYAYIARSLHHFPNRSEINSSFADAGFRLRASRTFLGGFVRAVWLEKRTFEISTQPDKAVRAGTTPTV